MKKFLLALFILTSFISAEAQNDTIPPPPPTPKKPRTVADLSNRANDHFLFQIGYDNWAKKPDSIDTKGFSRSFNFYLMFDFPFKTDPRFSVGIGIGVGTSNMYFDEIEVDVKGTTQTLRFRNVSDTNHFKKFKLVTAYLDAPVELRFNVDPTKSRSMKFAVGAKFGFLMNAHTKGKNLLNSSDNVINSYTRKESSKKYFNGNRLCVMARAGFGSFSLFTSYQLNSFIKEGMGPEVRPYSIGLTISGL